MELQTSQKINPIGIIAVAILYASAFLVPPPYRWGVGIIGIGFCVAAELHWQKHVKPLLGEQELRKINRRKGWFLAIWLAVTLFICAHTIIKINKKERMINEILKQEEIDLIK